MNNLSEYTNFFYDHREKVYYLNKQGAELIGMSDTPPTKNRNFKHTLMRNDLYIYLGMPKHWLKEHPIKLENKFIRPDVIFKKEGKQYFVEVDNTQKMSVNLEKIEDYKKLKDTYSKDFPEIIWLTTTELRRQNLSKICQSKSLACKVFLLSEIC